MFSYIKEFDAIYISQRHESIFRESKRCKTRQERELLDYINLLLQSIFAALKDVMHSFTFQRSRILSFISNFVSTRKRSRLEMRCEKWWKWRHEMCVCGKHEGGRRISLSQSVSSHKMKISGVKKSRIISERNLARIPWLGSQLGRVQTVTNTKETEEYESVVNRTTASRWLLCDKRMENVKESAVWRRRFLFLLKPLDRKIKHVINSRHACSRYNRYLSKRLDTI